MEKQKKKSRPHKQDIFRQLGCVIGLFVFVIVVLSCRVLPDLGLSQLRYEIISQVEDEALPENFVYVRGVGRHFTEVSSKQ